MAGVINAGTEVVETLATVVDRIRAALPYVVPDNLYPSTDFGMIPRGRAAAFGKMKVLADGARIVRTELASEVMAGIPRVGRPEK